MGDPLPPLVVELTVAASPEDAFDSWTEEATRWWPKGHTVSGDPVAIVVEPRVGGRIFERAGDGTEVDWGEVISWERPHRFAFHWHLFFARAEATQVELTFRPVAGGTCVRLEQRGWEALGNEGRVRRERTVHGWAAVTAPFAAYLGSRSTSIRHGELVDEQEQ